jgi:ribosomal protein S18 acetylase RimI-like enzyme
MMFTVLCLDKNWLTSKDAFSIYAPCMYQPTFDDFISQMEAYFADPSVKIYVCENDGEKAGILVLKEDGSEAEILGIAVKDDQRKKGLGKDMVYQVMESEHLRRITAQTDDDAIGFYRSSGFEAERVVIEYSDGSAVRYNCVLYNESSKFATED